MAMASMARVVVVVVESTATGVHPRRNPPMLQTKRAFFGLVLRLFLSRRRLGAPCTPGEGEAASMLQAAGASLLAGPLGPSLVERGERHAGNNFFQAVLRVNFPGITEHNGCDKQPANSAKHYCCWTHGYANDECAQYFNPPLTAYAFLTRSPYSWLVAMHSEPYEHDGVVPPSFSEFLRAPFSYTPGSYMSGPKDEQPNPVQLWAAKVDSYRSVTMPAANLTHLDLYDEEALTQRLAPLTAGGDFYQSPQERMLIEPVLAAAMNDKMDGSFTREEFNGAREYETGREWLQCAAPPGPPSSPPGPPPVSSSCLRIPCPNVLHAYCRYYNEEDLAFVNGIIGAQRLAAAGFEQITSNHLKRGVRKPAPSVWEATQHRRMSGLLDHPRWDRIGR